MLRTSQSRALVRAIGLALVLPCALALALVASPALAADQSYTIPSVKITAEVRPNGDLAVREERTFDFSGSFTFVYWELDKAPTNPAYAFGPIEITGMSDPGGAYTQQDSEDRIPGRYRVVDQGDTIRIDAYHDSTDVERTFILEYTVRGAAKAWDDTGELYWKFIGDRWDHGVGDVQIDVTFPGSVPEDFLQVWAHGPLTGLVEKSSNHMLLSVSDLPAATFVETRALFPREALPDAVPTPGARRQSVLDQEAQLADAANSERRSARAKVWGALVVGILGPILALGLAIVLFLRYGKERDSSYPGGYFRELPSDLPPAVVGALWRFGTIGDPETVATLMDLANRSVITVKPTTVSTPGLFGTKDEPTYELTLDTSKWDSLHAIEQELLSFLFTTIAGGTTLTLVGLKAAAKLRPQEFSSGMTDWKNAVSAEADKRGFFETTGGSLKWFFIVGAMGIAFLGIMASSFAESGWPLLSAFPCAIAIGVIAFQMPRRTAEANELYAKYRGLRDYLRDFSRLDEAPPTHIVLWEHFLVMAVVFGIAEKVIEAMRVKIPQVMNDPGLAHTVWWVSGGAGYISPASAISGGFASAASVASSAMSSSSGGGGAG
ncbi:MAG: hypothetical protein FD171_887 [Actinobacteria bacterium]|nr:MAG: hypothetical protein FD171_887 [Actinomycetota bacterium]